LLKEEILKGFLRILLIISVIREQILKRGILEYILFLIIAFCYSSIFYLYMIEGILIINKYILFTIIIIELLFIFFLGKILEIILKEDAKIGKYRYIQILLKFIDINFIYLIIDPLNYL